MKISSRFAIIGALAAVCLSPLARAQCGAYISCNSGVEYDENQNAVYMYSSTLNFYLLTTVGVSAYLYTPATAYYREDFDEGVMAVAQVGPVNDGDGNYYVYGYHYYWTALLSKTGFWTLK